jgi:hypothetical protein
MKYAAFVVLVSWASVARADLKPPPADTVVQQRARGVLERWLQAQNRGDFAAYQKLYAPGFSGVRRSGDKVVALDRAGWMSDRARMFKKKMRVRADDVRTSQNVQLTDVEFRQTWSSANYRDVGRKRITIVDEGAGPLIVHEEMLESAKSVKVKPLEDAEVALLHCLYKNVDQRWRLVDNTFEVDRVEGTTYLGGTAVHVVFYDDRQALGWCVGEKLMARNDSFSLPEAGEVSCGAHMEWSMDGENMELKSGVPALAFKANLVVVESDVSTVASTEGLVDGGETEGCEVDNLDGSGLALFVPVKGDFLRAYASTSINDSCDFSDCTNRNCTVETGKAGRAGWKDLVETCDMTERGGRHIKRTYRKTTTYKWNGSFYDESKSKVTDDETYEDEKDD